VVAFGTINISGLNVDFTSIDFSISLILPNLSLTVSFTLCSHMLLKLASIILLLFSLLFIFVIFGLENSQSYVSSSNLFSISTSDDKLASKINLDGYFRVFESF
jgi:ABC-type siderophore export system fused ATPase/permease subunit